MITTRFKHLPNTLTFCNMAIGILVFCLMIYNSSLSSIRLACYLIYISVILDTLDGNPDTLISAQKWVSNWIPLQISFRLG